MLPYGGKVEYYAILTYGDYVNVFVIRAPAYGGGGGGGYRLRAEVQRDSTSVVVDENNAIAQLLRRGLSGVAEYSRPRA